MLTPFEFTVHEEDSANGNHARQKKKRSQKIYDQDLLFHEAEGLKSCHNELHSLTKTAYRLANQGNLS